MAHDVEFHHLAADEYRASLSWYHRRSPEAAERFRAEIDRTLERIREAPLQGTVFRSTFHWMRTHRFPYLLYYEVVDSSLIRVYAIAHGRRRLGYWTRRKF